MKTTEQQDIFTVQLAAIPDLALSLGGEGQDGGGRMVRGGREGGKNPSEGVYLLSTPPNRSIFLIWVRVIIFHITAPGSRVKWLIF